jgi:hypothetical protein
VAAPINIRFAHFADLDWTVPMSERPAGHVIQSNFRPRHKGTCRAFNDKIICGSPAAKYRLPRIPSCGGIINGGQCPAL